MPVYSITNDPQGEFSGASIVLSDGNTLTVGHDHPDWDTIVAYLLSGGNDEKYIGELVSPFFSVAGSLKALSERVSVGAGVIYFDGDKLDNSLTKHIIRILHGGKDVKEESYRRFILFLEKLMTNPSAASRDHLYQFIEKHGITIAEDGDFIVYKSTRKDGRATHQGYGIVNGKVYENDYLPNSLGAIVTIPRSMVDDNRAVACSVGLHAGNYRYASKHSERLWRVKINPRDVVSVPSDSNDEKIRVCRYEVVGEGKDEITTPIANAKEYRGTAKAPKKSNAKSAQAKAAVDQPVSKEDEFKALIPTLVRQGVKLSSFKNKKVTAKNRPLFAKVAKSLGYEA